MKLRFLILPLLALALCACVKQEQQPQQPQAVQLEDRSHPRITVVYGGEAEQACVRVERKTLDDSGNLPRCIIQLKNLTTSRLPIEYQFAWLDAYGAPLQSSSAWQRVTLAQNGEKSLVDMGKSPEASTVTFYLRFPTDVQIWVPTPDPVQMMEEQRNQQ